MWRILAVALLLSSNCFPSLNFAADSSARVDHGTDTSLDDLFIANTQITMWLWVYRTVNGGNQSMMTKDGAFPSGWEFVVDNGAAEGQLRFIVFRGSGSGNWTDIQSNSTTAVPLNTWTFVAFTFDTSLATYGRLYKGNESTAVSEVGYALQQNGATPPDADATHSLYVGNLQRATTLSFKGRIARGGIITRALTLAQLEAIRDDLDGPISGANVANTIFLFDYDVDLTDQSANSNDGTSTNTSPAANFDTGGGGPVIRKRVQVITGAHRPVALEDRRRRLLV
jgi:hypothetical protein